MSPASTVSGTPATEEQLRASRTMRVVISEVLQIGRADGVSASALLEVLRHDNPAWNQPEDSFDRGPGHTFNRNLVEQIDYHAAQQTVAISFHPDSGTALAEELARFAQETNP